MSSILMILAHCDDEVLWGYPIIQYSSINTIYLLTLTNNNKYGEGPQNALKEVCNINKINLVENRRLQPNFYNLPTRYNDFVLTDAIQIIKHDIEWAIDMLKPDWIFTHNPMGEYGHGDHRTVFNIVSQYSIPLMLTDICFSNNCHLSSDIIPGIYKNYLYAKTKNKEKFVLYTEWYNNMKNIYEKHRAWSWGGHEPVKECNLYMF